MVAGCGALSWLRSIAAQGFLAAFLFAIIETPAGAINILVDYRYDSNNFFTTNQAARDALQAAADRYSRVITSSLSAVSLATEANFDPRIGFTHPGTGIIFRISTAASATSDSVVSTFSQPAADEYRPISIAANQWILYAGGRDLSSQAVAGQRGVVNFDEVFNASGSIMNRNFRAAGSIMNLPVWGGSIAFDSVGTNWHFNHTTAAPNGTFDFYSFALHEIGHALGLNKGDWLEWTSHLSGRQYTGQAVAAYNADNGTSLNALITDSNFPPHWDDGDYDSFIFSNAGPNYVDTVGAGALQDLLMEPTLTNGRRFELTNVDVAALRDVGWSTVPHITAQAGDFDGNGAVNAADYPLIRKGIAGGTYASWKANFGESLATMIATDSAHVPEPASWLLIAVSIASRGMARRR